MFIVIRQAPLETDQILNIFYSNDITPIRNWVKEYINEDIESYRYTPNQKNIKNVFYELNDGYTSLQLLKRYKIVYKGYVYNSSEKLTDTIYSINILEYNSNYVNYLETSDMWKNINQEINNRVLKQLDKDTLIQILHKIQQRIETKSHWNKTEFVGLFTEILKNFRKDLYSSVAKRMKRFGKRKSIYKKDNDVHHTIINIPDTPQVPPNFNAPRLPCKLEAINPQAKQE
jgi:hypothetical protein